MEIVGNGFLARHLRSIEGSRPGVLAMAAGVSAAGHTGEEGFSREARLLYDLIRRCALTGERLLFFSTASTGMYSVPGQPGTEDGPVFPATAYGRHKLALESVLAASAVDFLIVRLGHVVGPGQPAHQLLPSLVAQVRSGSVRVLSGARRDLIDVDDVVKIISMLLDTGISRVIVNVASGFATPVEHIVDHLELRLGIRARRHAEPWPARQQISTARLLALVPAVAEMGFDTRYYIRVLDKYVGEPLSAAFAPRPERGPA